MFKFCKLISCANQSLPVFNGKAVCCHECILCLVRTKQLTWVARVVKDKDYHQSRAQALEIQREKKKFEDQRHALRRCSITHAALLSGVIVNPSIVSEQAHEEKLKIKDLENEIASLKNSVRQYQLDCENGQNELESLEEEISKLHNSKHLINESWQFSVKQLEAVQSDLKTALAEISNFKSNEKVLKSTVDELERRVEKMTDELKASEIRELEVTDACKDALTQADADKEAMKICFENQISLLEQKMKRDADNAAMERNQIRSDLELKLSELSASYEALELKLNKTTPSMGGGFFVDTISELELSNRLDQLEKENALLETQKEKLENELKQARKKLMEYKDKD